MAARVGFLAILFLRACSSSLWAFLAPAVTAFTGRGFPDFHSYGQPNGIEYFAGFKVAYVLSATVWLGRLVLLIFYGCYRANYVIEGNRSLWLFGAPIWPINLLQALGAAMLLADLIITQVTNGK